MEKILTDLSDLIGELDHQVMEANNKRESNNENNLPVAAAKNGATVMALESVTVRLRMLLAEHMEVYGTRVSMTPMEKIIFLVDNIKFNSPAFTPTLSLIRMIASGVNVSVDGDINELLKNVQYLESGNDNPATDDDPRITVRTTITLAAVDTFLIDLTANIDAAIINNFRDVGPFTTTLMVNLDGWFVKVVNSNHAPYVIQIQTDMSITDITSAVIAALRNSSFGRKK